MRALSRSGNPTTVAVCLARTGKCSGQVPVSRKEKVGVAVMAVILSGPESKQSLKHASARNSPAHGTPDTLFA
jgi:hypothetical protein